MRVGIDLGGADVDQGLLDAACLELASGSLASHFLVYTSLPKVSSLPNVEYMHCPDVIAMHEGPLSAIRRKKGSSLVQSVLDLSAGRIGALVTCGNTGAVTAASVVLLKRFAGLHHPALVAELPLVSGRSVILDVGAFVSATARDLFAYARLGAAYARVVLGRPSPTIGLLNIGKEAGRGTFELRQAGLLLQDAPCYLGNVEPRDVLSGLVDVTVTGGFAGNIFLKTAEALAKKHPSQGALVAGVRGAVIKCHGACSKEAFLGAIRGAVAFSMTAICSRLEAQFLATSTWA